MVVQTRFSSCGFSISHAKQRPPAAHQRATRVRGDHPAPGNREIESRSLWLREFSRFGGCGCGCRLLGGEALQRADLVSSHQT
jgi:hypothetical protein